MRNSKANVRYGAKIMTALCRLHFIIYEKLQGEYQIWLIICDACGINGSIIITIVQKRIYTRENGNKESELWIS